MLDALAAHLKDLPNVSAVEARDGELLVDTSGASMHSFRITFDRGFPLSLPKIYLQSPKNYGFFPHVAWTGEVCVSDGQAASIDVSQQASVVEHVLLRAIEVLDNNVAGGDAFWDEFEGYWNNQDKKLNTVCLLEPSGTFQQIEARISKEGFPSIFYEHPWDDERFTYIKRSRFWKQGTGVAYYCPLEENVGFPKPGDSITISDLESVIDKMSTENRNALWGAFDAGSNSQRSQKFKKPLNLLISQPRPSTGRSLVAVTIPYGHQVLRGNHELFEMGAIPCRVYRLTDDYTTPRSGGDSKLSSARVGIVGIGALGSEIANLLCAGGVRNFWFFDHDDYTTDNILRHALPTTYLGGNKADAMAEHLKAQYPFIRIEPVPRAILEPDDLIAYTLDAVVVAVGGPTLERAIAKERPAPVIVTTWLEAMGLGGHAVLDDETVGCLHCLYHRDNSPDIESSTRMIARGEVVSRNLTGCEGSFVPFGAVDAAQTAAIACRLLMSRLAGDRSTRKYAYWRGSDLLARREKINTSPWYEGADTDHGKTVTDAMFQDGCPICRGRADEK